MRPVDSRAAASYCDGIETIWADPLGFDRVPPLRLRAPPQQPCKVTPALLPGTLSRRQEGQLETAALIMRQLLILDWEMHSESL